MGRRSGAQNLKEPRAKSQEPRAKSQEPRAKSQEPRAKSQEPRAKSQEPRAKSQEPGYTSDLSLPARRSAPWRAAACLLLFALAAPAPGLAQTTALWNATLTVGSTTSGGQTTFGYRPSVPGSQQGFGSLSPNTFTRGTATVNVIRLVYNSGASGTLDFQISLASGTIPPDGLLGAVGLVLALGSETFAFTPGTSAQYGFDRGGLSWNDGDTVAVSLAIAAPEPPTALQAAPYPGLCKRSKFK